MNKEKTPVETVSKETKKPELKKLQDSDLMPYGKYKGSKMIDVPASYLMYLYDNKMCSDNVKIYIEENKEVIEKELKEK